MDYFEQNRKSWNELTELHAKSDFYDINSFLKGKTTLNHIEIKELGDIRKKKILHLQCHFGLDTLSLARKGAEVVGIDISDKSIKLAKELTRTLNLDARFYQTNIYDIENILDESFDIVYTSYGALNWLNDLNKWARIINKYLKPDGFFYIVEFHPFIYTLKNFKIHYNYFKQHTFETDVDESYTDNSKVSNKNLKHFEWHHSISEILNSLIFNGLKIKFFNEYPYLVYNCFPDLIEIEEKKWVLKKYKNKIPYMYSLKAQKNKIHKIQNT